MALKGKRSAKPLLRFIFGWKRDKRTASAGFFDLKYPEKTNTLGKDIKIWYFDGYKTGWSDVLKSVQIDVFEEKIKEQRKHKGYGGYRILIAKDGGWSGNVTQAHASSYSEGYSDGMNFANKLLDDAINKNYEQENIVDDLKKVKTTLKE